ncbi:MAG: hypothetical protein DRO73_10240 [Candidatus Thorarchaeota archaeon]|nr:MAG: hypothetical protein DRO73_10240 [Candidatus Thorarchaeota archaeon]RLI62675.1 MAG: hypothetical protein DRO93_00720 [Candidatus Thorarchaeota archaeon]
MAERLYRLISEQRDRLGTAVSTSDVFERQFGSEMASWELMLQKQFREHVSGRTYIHRGFVHHTRDTSLVMLTPSPWLADGVLIYFRPDQTLPPDGAFVETVGQRIAAPGLLQRSDATVEAFTADSVSDLPLDFLREIRPPFTLEELSDLLFEHVGMAEPSKQVFARLFVSSPPFESAIGGFTTGVQALVSKRQVQRLMTFMKRVLPPTLRGRHGPYHSVRGVRVSTPRVWRLDVGSIARSRLRALCLERQDPAGFKEVSVGALTNNVTSALPDVPLALGHEDFWVETRDATDLRLPVLKSAITYQLLAPAVARRSVEAMTRHVLSGLEHLRDSFGLDASTLARGGVLDADTLGRPLSVVRLARSTARAEWRDKVTARELRRSWDRVLEPALKEFLEIAVLGAEAEHEWGGRQKYSKFDTRVLRALKRLDTGVSGSLGPSLDEIAAEAKVEVHVAAEALEKMKTAGVVYEPRPHHFRLV